jgi:hypothetical protein
MESNNLSVSIEYLKVIKYFSFSGQNDALAAEQHFLNVVATQTCRVPEGQQMGNI